MRNKRTSPDPKRQLIRANRTEQCLQSASMEDVMREKWDLHKAIKSSLDLFAHKNKINPAVQNPSDESQNSDEDIQGKEFRRLVMARKKGLFREFRQKCEQLTRKNQKLNAAKYLHERTLMKKVMLAKGWRVEVNNAKKARTETLKQYTRNRGKLSFYNRLATLIKLKSDSAQKQSRVTKIILRRFFDKFLQARQKSKSIHQQIKVVQDIRSSKRPKIVPNFARFSPRTTTKQFHLPVGPNAKQPIVRVHSNISPPRLIVKHTLIANDFRVQMTIVAKKQFFKRMLMAKNKQGLLDFQKRLSASLKTEFLYRLKFHLEIKLARRVLLVHKGTTLIRNLKINKRAILALRSLGKKTQFKMKQVGVVALQDHRQRSIMSGLCFNIIASKKINQLQENAFKTLVDNVQRQKIKSLLVQQLQRRNRFKLSQKCFGRWKHYRPEYLNQTHYDQSIVEVQNTRDREETGTPDLLRNEIRDLCFRVFVGRLVGRVRQIRERQEVLNSCQIILKSSLNQTDRDRRLARKPLRVQALQAVFDRLKQHKDISKRYDELVSALFKKGVQAVLRKKYISPQKAQRIQRYLRIVQTTQFFSKCLNQRTSAKQTMVMQRQVMSKRLISKFLRLHNGSAQLNTKRKYTQGLLTKSHQLKSKYRLLHQLKNGNQSNLEQKRSGVRLVRLQGYFRMLNIAHQTQIKNQTLKQILKRSQWDCLRRGVDSITKSQCKMDHRHQSLHARVKLGRTKRVFRVLSGRIAVNALQVTRLQLLKDNDKILKQKLFFAQLLLVSEDNRLERVDKSRQQRIDSYSRKRYENNLKTKTFFALKRESQNSQKSEETQLLLTAFQALKTIRIQALLLRKHLSQYQCISQHQGISYYPSSHQQRQSFKQLKQCT